MAEIGQIVLETETVSIVVKTIAMGPAFGKSQKCRKDNHFKAVCKSSEKCDTSLSRPKKGQRKKVP